MSQRDVHIQPPKTETPRDLFVRLRGGLEAIGA